jgi:hypothetical protein
MTLADQTERGERDSAVSLGIIRRCSCRTLRITATCRSSQPIRQSRQEPLYIPMPRYIHQPNLQAYERGHPLAQGRQAKESDQGGCRGGRNRRTNLYACNASRCINRVRALSCSVWRRIDGACTQILGRDQCPVRSV